MELINLGYANKAKETIELLIEDYPEDYEWKTYLASAHYALNDIASAIVSLRKTYLHNPIDEDNLYNLGFMYILDGDIRKAVYYLRLLKNITQNSDLIKSIDEMLDDCYKYL